MIIKELIVKKLYGHYDYHVRFNDDIAFIHNLCREVCNKWKMFFQTNLMDFQK